MRGTRNGGGLWTLTRVNRYASIYDIAQDNEFTAVKLTNVTLNATVTPDYASYTADRADQHLPPHARATAGSTGVDAQLLWAPSLAPVRFDVPARAISEGTHSVTGRASVYHGTPAATSFLELLAPLRNAPRNNELAIQLRLLGDAGEQLATQVLALEEIVSGQLDYGDHRLTT